MEQKRIEVKNLTKTFGKQAVLRDISFTQNTGRSLAVLGAAASGKSVLLKTLAGLYTPDKGDVLIEGQALSIEARRPRIGMLFQKNALFDSLTIWENIAFRLLSQNMTRPEAQEKVNALLPRVGLPMTTALLYPSDLSGGMQKRVGFARAIISAPDILLLDSPTDGLDPILAARIDNMIAEETQRHGVNVIAATSTLSPAYDEIAVLADGMLYWHGTRQEALASSDKHLKQLLN